MKRFVTLLLGLSLLAFTGCPPQAPTSPGAPPAPKTPPGTTAPDAIADAKTDVAKEVGEAVKETKEAAAAVAEVAVEKTKEAAEVVKEKAEKAAEVVKEKAGEAAEAAKETAEKVVDAAKEQYVKLLGKVEGKPKEILDILHGHKTKRVFDPAKHASRKPKVFATMPADMHTPDGMTVSDKTGTLFMSVPNFARRKDDKGPKTHPACLVTVSMDGKVTKLFAFEEAFKDLVPATGQIGPMGIDFGPDGHLYVCDNQYFFDPANKSRILRVLMDGDKPTGKAEVVVEGIKLANAIMWLGDNLYLTDTFLDLEGQFGSGCLWKFGKDEVLKAGSGAGDAKQPPIKLNPLKKVEDDPHCVSIQMVKKIPGGGNGGMDGMTADKDGVIYVGNFGNGEMYRFVFDKDGKAAVDVIHPAGEYFHCCDGIYFDKGTNKVYVTDSASNAVHAFAPPKAGEKAFFETIWENGNTDGADGSLDQPCEPVVIGKKLIVVNFDWPFPELLNTTSDDPSTLSVIELE